MPDIEDKVKPPEMTETGEKPGLEEAGDDKKFRCQFQDMMGENVKSLHAKLDRILEVLQIAFNEGKGEEAPGEGMGEEPPGEEQPAKPSPVAMQKYQELERRLFQLENSRNTESYVARLRNLCEDNPGVSFDEEFAVLQKFSTDKDRRVFVEALEAKATRYTMHEATQFAQNFRVAPNDVLKKFGNLSPALQRKAKQALQDWRDTVNQTNSRAALQFQAQFPTAEKYIESQIMLEQAAMGQ